MTPEQERTRKIQEGLSNVRNMNLPSTTDVVQGIEHMKASPMHATIDEKVSPTRKTCP